MSRIGLAIQREDRVGRVSFLVPSAVRSLRSLLKADAYTHIPSCSRPMEMFCESLRFHAGELLSSRVRGVT